MAEKMKRAKVSNNDIAIVTDDPGWHGRKLKEALFKHGFNSHYLSLSECSIEITTAGPIISMPGFHNELPLGVFVRGVPGGSLEQVIFRLNVLHILSDLGVTVFNSGRAIERTVDKSMTSYLLQKAGIPSPPTWIFECKEKARALYLREKQANRKLVLKPMFGSQGIGVQMLTEDPLEMDDEVTQGLFYLQRFIDKSQGNWEDIRVLVIDGKARAAMLRKGNDWITNRTQGAVCHPIKLDSKIQNMAEAATAAVDIDYAGVDLIVDDQGKLQVLEVNSIPAWWGLQKVIKQDIATFLIDAFVDKIKHNQAIAKLS